MSKSAEPTPPADALLLQQESLLKNLAQAVQLTRWEEGWSRRQLAEASGLSERFIADVEYGKANPSLSSLVALAQALALNVPSMLSGDGHLLPALGQALAGLDSSRQRELVQYIEAKYGGKQPARRIALLGPRGAGKTVVGELVAKTLGVPFVELDRAVEDLAQLPLAQLFEMHGDAHVRRLESEALRNVLHTHHDVVIATGGGLVANAEAYDYLRERCRTVWLKAKPEEYLARALKQGEKRALEKRPQALADLRVLLAAREPAYKLAEMAVETSGVEPEQLAQRIAKWSGRAQKTKTSRTLE